MYLRVWDFYKEHRAQQPQFCEWLSFHLHSTALFWEQPKLWLCLNSVRLKGSLLTRVLVGMPQLMKQLPSSDLRAAAVFIPHHTTSKAILSIILATIHLCCVLSAVHGQLGTSYIGSRKWFEGLFKIFNTFLCKKYELCLGLSLLVLRMQAVSLTTHSAVLYIKHALIFFWKKMLVIKTVVSGCIQLFDLYFYKAYL